jgi:4'-phosphopantetheinyl transferase
VKRPIGSGLFLSISRRGPFTAVALAASQVGVDVELVEGDGEIPWNVLHPSESAMLRQEDGPARAAAFARLWSLKEAYLKALGIGLFREPSSFALRFADRESATFIDPLAPDRVAEAKTVWRTNDGARAAVSTVVLERPQQDAS